MRINQVNMSGFRNFTSATFSPGPTVNLFVGQNGCGKSSLLEALYVFGYGRSFRASLLNTTINHESSDFTLFLKSQLSDSSDQLHEYKFGFSRQRSGVSTLKINGELRHKVSDMAKLLPLQLFTPQSSDVITGSPNDRRRFLDWGLFHVEHVFFAEAHKFKRALKQRNALLKSRSDYDSKMDEYWCEQLVAHGNELDRLRKSYLDSLIPFIVKNCERFLSGLVVKLSYSSGWNKESSLYNALQNNTHRDRMKGYTSVGPHKADVKIKVDGYSASESLSRGQLRVLMASIQLAQTQHLKEEKDRQSIFLLDDVGAELDAIKRRVFIDLLLECDAQIFVTAIDRAQFTLPSNCSTMKVFHVEHGQVTEELT